MKKYEILPHPSELRLRIYGKTLEELFKNAALALAEILKHNAEKIFEKRPKAKSYKLKAKSLDINSLLVDFLSEILAKSQINKCIYLTRDINLRTSDVLRLLEAKLMAYPVERFDEDIKAVTYYGVDIKKNFQGIWQTEIVLDI
jgi:SHS2 domain-containing protein